MDSKLFPAGQLVYEWQMHQWIDLFFLLTSSPSNNVSLLLTGVMMKLLQFQPEIFFSWSAFRKMEEGTRNDHQDWDSRSVSMNTYPLLIFFSYSLPSFFSFFSFLSSFYFLKFWKFLSKKNGNREERNDHLNFVWWIHIQRNQQNLSSFDHQLQQFTLEVSFPLLFFLNIHSVFSSSFFTFFHSSFREFSLLEIKLKEEEPRERNEERESQEERAKGSHFRACCASNSLLTCWSDRKSAWIQNQQIIMNLSPLLPHPSFFLFFFEKSSLFHSTIISSYTWEKEGTKNIKKKGKENDRNCRHRQSNHMYSQWEWETVDRKNLKQE